MSPEHICWPGVSSHTMQKSDGGFQTVVPGFSGLWGGGLWRRGVGCTVAGKSHFHSARVVSVLYILYISCASKKTRGPCVISGL